MSITTASSEPPHFDIPLTCQWFVDWSNTPLLEMQRVQFPKSGWRRLDKKRKVPFRTSKKLPPWSTTIHAWRHKESQCLWVYRSCSQWPWSYLSQLWMHLTGCQHFCKFASNSKPPALLLPVWEVELSLNTGFRNANYCYWEAIILGKSNFGIFFSIL